MKNKKIYFIFIVLLIMLTGCNLMPKENYNYSSNNLDYKFRQDEEKCRRIIKNSTSNYSHGLLSELSNSSGGGYDNGFNTMSAIFKISDLSKKKNYMMKVCLSKLGWQ